jgi:hypothetical protein
MYDLDKTEKAFEGAFGLMSGYYLFELHQVSTAAGSNWDLSKPETMEIVVTKDNATWIYGICKEIRLGYNVGFTSSQIKKVKEARAKAHRFLFEEANDPNTPIERKIYLVKLTGKNAQ